jgi:hypothetical protein
MEAIKIRREVILDAMLDELQLPKSTSETVINTNGTVTATAVFFPSAKFLHQRNHTRARAIQIAISMLLKMKQCMQQFSTWSVELKTTKIL